jgi:hypothetical protein
LETEEDELDYCQLIVESVDGSSVASEGASSIALPSTGRIVSIDALADGHVDVKVRIDHDAALIFNQADGAAAGPVAG